MKKVISALLFALVLPLQAQELWKEGTHFDVVAEKATSKPEVMEFFSYWCPHCYQFEPIVGQVKGKLDKDVAFKKVHVNFMGFAGREVQNDASRAMLVARAMKREDIVTKAIFDHIHTKRRPITGVDDLKNIFIAAGVDGEKFDKLASSFSVNSLLKRNDGLLNKYRGQVSGVPTFIINGKFKPTFTREMTADDMVDLIVWLSKQS